MVEDYEKQMLDELTRAQRLEQELRALHIASDDYSTVESVVGWSSTPEPKVAPTSSPKRSHAFPRAAALAETAAAQVS